uniref:Carboxylic ester hydrolase n=1 Tax=Plectus sambesii TaxID=2011161 RepID=A0A914W7W1_9BILA
MTSQNRFGPPERKDPSGQILAFHFGPQCLQAGAGQFDEDCLYLNIYTPRVANITHQHYPVFLWIHGGGFVGGSGNLETEGILNNLVSRDLIVVGINYRLGPFGFFSTRDSTIPGNVGLLDQIEAINWVKRYISYFGGDPNSITIGGESAGAMSVSLLTLSPVSQHLFKQALLESGSGFSAGYFSSSELPSDASKSAAIYLQCITAEQWDRHDPALMSQMVQCLRSKKATDILNAHKLGRFLPVVDGPGGVIPQRLEVLAQHRPPIPILTGNNQAEYLFWLFEDGLLHSSDYVNRFTRQSSTSDLAHRPELQYYNNSQLVLPAIQRAYIDSINLTDQDHIGWCNENIQLYTEMVFMGPTYRDAMLFRQTKSRVYLYSFDYLAPGALPTLTAQLRGVPHGWQKQYAFGYPGTADGGWKLTDDDRSTEDYFGQFWANFVKYGNPTPTPSTIVWPQLGSKGEYIILGPKPTPSSGFHPKALFFACTVPAIE